MKKFSLFTLLCALGLTAFFQSSNAFALQQRQAFKPIVSPLIQTVPTVLNAQDEELRCLHLVNEERIRRKLPILTYDATLAEASRSWSLTMTRSGFRHGYGREIIARGGQSATFAFRIWMNSPPHRAQLLSPNYQTVGFGTVNGFWTGRFR
ncbi:MAG: CAP domain-containing protein [Planctomycetaceae bacterium]|nr:CAP domain-containing protein [Planctomycetaceae bacterium]